MFIVLLAVVLLLVTAPRARRDPRDLLFSDLSSSSCGDLPEKRVEYRMKLVPLFVLALAGAASALLVAPLAATRTAVSPMMACNGGKGGSGGKGKGKGKGKDKAKGGKGLRTKVWVIIRGGPSVVKKRRRNHPRHGL